MGQREYAGHEPARSQQVPEAGSSQSVAGRPAHADPGVIVQQRFTDSAAGHPLQLFGVPRALHRQDVLEVPDLESRPQEINSNCHEDFGEYAD
jgi:hypothetical protein